MKLLMFSLLSIIACCQGMDTEFPIENGISWSTFFRRFSVARCHCLDRALQMSYEVRRIGYHLNQCHFVPNVFVSLTDDATFRYHPDPEDRNYLKWLCMASSNPRPMWDEKWKFQLDPTGIEPTKYRSVERMSSPVFVDKIMLLFFLFCAAGCLCKEFVDWDMIPFSGHDEMLCLIVWRVVLWLIILETSHLLLCSMQIMF